VKVTPAAHSGHVLVNLIGLVRKSCSWSFLFLTRPREPKKHSGPANPGRPIRVNERFVRSSEASRAVTPWPAHLRAFDLRRGQIRRPLPSRGLYCGTNPSRSSPGGKAPQART